jgi:O-succinylbenzoate synthase
LDSFRRFAPGPASRSIDDEKEPEFDKDVRQSDEFRQGDWLGSVPLGKAERSTGSDSAQMIVQEEVSEEEIQRRLAMPEAASSVESAPPKVKKGPRMPSGRPSVAVVSPLTDAERETLEKNTREISNNVKYRKKLIKAVEDGVISSADFINNLDEVAAWLKANKLTTVASTGANLKGYVKAMFGKRVALIEETQRLREKDRLYQQSKQAFE